MDENQNNMDTLNGQNHYTGVIILAIMLIVVGIMGYFFYDSCRNPAPMPDNSPNGIIASNETSPVGATAEPSPLLSPAASPSPEATETPVTSPSVKVSPTAVSSPPAPSPTPAEVKKDLYDDSAPVEGPPDLEKGGSGFFAGKTGKAYISIKMKEWTGTGVYLIDNSKKQYKSLQFDRNKNGRYVAEIPPGDYGIKIVKRGYFAFLYDLSLKSDDVAQIDEPLDKRPSLNIKSSPAGAEIYIDEKYAGVAPKTVKNFNETSYSVKVMKKGYKTESFDIKFIRGKDVSKEVKLTPQ